MVCRVKGGDVILICLRMIIYFISLTHICDHGPYRVIKPLNGFQLLCQ